MLFTKYIHFYKINAHHRTLLALDLAVFTIDLYQSLVISRWWIALHSYSNVHARTRCQFYHQRTCGSLLLSQPCNALLLSNLLQVSGEVLPVGAIYWIFLWFDGCLIVICVRERRHGCPASLASVASWFASA
jgi:hypothetical protein